MYDLCCASEVCEANEVHNHKYKTMTRYSLEPRDRRYVEGYGFLSFARNFGNRYGKKLVDSAAKQVKQSGKEALKTASKRVVQKTAEATGDLIGSKIADKIVKHKPKPEEEVPISPEKRQQIINDLRLV